ncbi:MAG TPA: hypothetical protein VFM17_05130, partial [Candidatus Eisenbacteria bacterium]|nr:hypothetical protein [Candidatus Eisenbacteria bacterium]
MSLPFVEALYADYLRDPASVPDEWRRQFDAMRETNGFASRPQLAPTFPRRALYGTPRPSGRNGSAVNPLLLVTDGAGAGAGAGAG